ncbi:exported hypothetical protein [Stutzerimonas xanthomarina]|nr:exported hypothetical protein [Stutzerimonas xanthomarina]
MRVPLSVMNNSFAALFALTGLLGAGEARLLHRKTRRMESGDSPNQKRFFRVYLVSQPASDSLFNADYAGSLN